MSSQGVYYDLKTVKDAARGLWSGIHFAILGYYLPTKHGPCQIHGGKDKSRGFDDYDEGGGGVCNECGKMADGFAVIRAHQGCTLPEAIKLVAEHLGLQPNTPSRKREQLDPAANLEFHGQSIGMALIFCMKKKGIKPEAIWAIDGQYATYRKRYPVFAIPAKGEKNEIVGYCIYGATGKDLPIWEKGNKEPIDWRKIKVTAGSQPGWIGMDKPDNPKVGWKPEGPSCLLALISLGFPDGHFACCNLFGATEDPASSPWMLERFRDVPEVFIVHDSDSAGQSGATHVVNGDRSRPGWAPAIANVAGRVRNYVLPWPMVDSHGKDLRDLIIQRTSANNTGFDIYQHLIESARRGDKIDPTALKAKSGSGKNDSALDFSNCDGSGKFFYPKPILKTVQSLFDRTDKWPKRAGNKLFVVEHENVRYLDKTSRLFAWIQEKLTTEWKSIGPSKDEFKESLLARTDRFDSVESVPHFPRIPGVYYTCSDRPAGGGRYLEAFLDFFCPATPTDRQLLFAAIATTFWGGHPGGRPGFQFATPDGVAQGAGKTTVATTIAKLSGGSVDFDQDCKREEITKRLLNGETGCRVVLLDNVKAKIFSSASYESLITSKSISGHEMYSGNASKPNHFTYFITFNSANFSRDMAQRLVSIVLGDATKTSDWQTRIDSYLSSHHHDIIDDVKAFFERPKKKLSKYNRWATWQGEVISRLEDPETIIEVLYGREQQNDGDAKSAIDILDHIEDFLLGYTYSSPYRVHVGFAELARIVSSAIGSPHTAREAGLLIDRLIGSGLISNMKRNPCRSDGKGFLYWSEDGVSLPVSYDLANRIEILEIARDNKKEKRRHDARMGIY